jgi:hypothetical protein
VCAAIVLEPLREQEGLMHGTRSLGAATWLFLACAGEQSPPKPQTPAYSRADEVVTAAPHASQATRSECAADGDCQRDCERGVSSACARWGDRLYASAAQRAEDLWADACKAGDGAACARLMQTTAGDAEVSDRYGRRACLQGDAIACEFLGNAMFTRALAPTPKEDSEQLFRDSARSYRLACHHERWLGCVRAAASLQRIGDEATRTEERALARRGFELADARCKDSSPEACDFLAQWAEKAGDAAKATEAYARGCRALLERGSPGERHRLIDEPLCRRARQLGVAPPDLRDTAPARTLREPQIVPDVALEAKRIAGEAQIQPPLGVAKYIAKNHIPMVKASAVLCLSELGLVSNLNIDLASGSTTYDRRLFEGMRTWRYRPFLVDGEPKPVCTRVTFVYRPG